MLPAYDSEAALNKQLTLSERDERIKDLDLHSFVLALCAMF